MAFIPYVSYGDAEGLLARLYAGYRGDSGEVDNILRVHSLNPRSMRDHAQLYEHLMRGESPLSHVQREMLALVVSVENRCFY